MASGENTSLPLGRASTERLDPIATSAFLGANCFN